MKLFSAICVAGIPAMLTKPFTTDSNWIISDSPHTEQEWSDAVNYLAGTPGEKARLLQADATRSIFRTLLEIGTIEVAAFELMVANPGKKLSEIKTLLNEHIPTTNTVNYQPYTLARIYVWYKSVLQMEAPILNSDQGEYFLRSNVEVHTRGSGIDVLVMSVTAWEKIVYPVLLIYVPRPWGNIMRPDPLTPREHQVLLPPIAREYVHNAILDAGHYTRGQALFDSTSDLANRTREYFFSILVHASMDVRVFDFLQRQQNPPCKDKDPIELAEQANALFRENEEPIWGVRYTPERIRFWCRDIFGGPGIRLGDIELSHVSLVDHQNYYLLPRDLMLKGVESIDSNNGVIKIFAPDDVVIAWNDFKKNLAVPKKRIYEHDISSSGVLRHIIIETDLPREARIQVLQELSDRAKSFADLARPEDLVFITKAHNVSLAQVTAYAEQVKSYAHIPLAVAERLEDIYARRLDVDVVEIATETDVSPERIHLFYEMMMEARRQGLTLYYLGLNNFAFQWTHIWQRIAVLATLETQ